MSSQATEQPPSAASSRRPLTVEQAIDAVFRDFPIPGYLHEGRKAQYRTIGTTVARLLPPGAAILDFGSGACDSSAVVAHMGYEVHAGDDLKDPWHQASDSRRKILEFAAHANVNFKLLAHPAPLPWEKGRFDMVMLHHVLEHFADSPRDLLNDLLELTRPGGYLFITVPNAGNLRKRIDLLRGRSNMPAYGMYYWMQGPWRGHHREYVRSDLIQLADFLGLNVLELTSYHFMIEVIPKRLRPAWKAATTLVPGWRDSWLMVAQKRADWKPLRSVPAESPHLKARHARSS